jgi:7-carboxy-7-deazaguanine synthase
MHAVDPDIIHATAKRMDEEEIIDQINLLGSSDTAKWVTLSGGDPLHWDLKGLVLTLSRDLQLKVAVETQGAFFNSWLLPCDLITCSPKAPSSGMTSRTDYAILDKYAELYKKVVFKVVVFDEADLEFAKHIHMRYVGVPFYISCGTLVYGSNRSAFLMTQDIMGRYKWLVDTVLGDPDLVDATVLPQLHAMLWGNMKGK